MSDLLAALLQRQVDAGVIPGAVAILGGPDAQPVAVGAASVGGPPLRADALFRIQSMTKAITAVAVLRLVEAGSLSLDDPVDPWLPELANRRVLSRPDAALDQTQPAVRPITVRHLLTNTSGYGMLVEDSPLAAAMEADATAAGSGPVPFGAQEWLTRLAALPLAFPPGEGWRYHHSYPVLGVLIARVAGRSLGAQLATDIFAPLGMGDTGLWVPPDRAIRLPAAHRCVDGVLLETEPAGGGPYVGTPAHDLEHGELVSTIADYHRFLRMLTTGGRVDGQSFLTAEHLALMTSDQIPARIKSDDSFYPGFWDDSGWGFGVQVATGGVNRGRYGWSGGQGTDFFVDPDQTIGILLTQVEMGEPVWALIQQFRGLR